MHQAAHAATAARIALVASLAVALILTLAGPALAHVPFLEPAGMVSSSRGPAGDPFPDAIAIGSPEVSRAVYGYLGPKDTADVYRFSVKSDVTAPVAILVPKGPGAETFRPELTIYGTDKPIGLFDRGASARGTFYEPFSQMTLYRGPSAEVTFTPGGVYYLIVTPGKGATRSGRYVVSVGTVEAFGPADLAAAPMEIARIKAGDFGGAAADWTWTVPWAVGAVLVLVAAVALTVLAVRRRRRVRDAAPGR
jgi:hypothetical protein